MAAAPAWAHGPYECPSLGYGHRATCGKHPTAYGRYDGLYKTEIRSTRVDIGQAS
jgi:hypothetical protein